jgi:hypothetical protein
MDQEQLEQLVKTLVEESLRLQAELVATQTLAMVALANNPEAVRTMGQLAPMADDFTLAAAMTEDQRKVIRERMETSRATLKAHRRLSYPGGIRGLKSWLQERLRALWLVCFGPARLEVYEDGFKPLAAVKQPEW